MEDHGAFATLSFLDCGLPSTAHVRDLAPYARAILSDLAAKNPDVIVVELGDGILGDYRVGTFFGDPDLVRATKAVVMCANDLVAAWGAQKLMEQWKIPITIVSGPVTDNQTGTEYIVQELHLPAANAKTDGRALFGVVYEEIHRGDIRARGGGPDVGRIGKSVRRSGNDDSRRDLRRGRVRRRRAPASAPRSSEGRAGRRHLAVPGRAAGVRRPHAPLAADGPEIHERDSRGTGRARGRLPRGRSRLCRRRGASASRPRHSRDRSLRRFPPEGSEVVREVLRSRARRISRDSRSSSTACPSSSGKRSRRRARSPLRAASPRRRSSRVAPLWRAGAVADGAPVSVFAITGSSGAGVTPTPTTHHPRRASAFFAYAIDGHRHLPEIEESLSAIGAPAAGRIVFQTHSAPLVRGIFATAAVPLESPMDRDGSREVYRKAYEQRVLRAADGRTLRTSRPSRGRTSPTSAGRRLGDGRVAKVFVAIDNLVKGAAGQAIQAMNILFDIPEPTGLKMTGVFP